MAVSGQVKYKVGFEVDDSQLKKVRQALNSIQNINFQSIGTAGIANLKSINMTLEQVKSNSVTLSSALTKAFNPSTGLVDYNKLIKQMGNGTASFGDTLKGLNAIGAPGQKAIASMITSMGKLQLQAVETKSVFGKLADSFQRVITYQLTTKAFQAITGSFQKAWSYVKELDTSLNNIRIVTGKGADQMQRFALKATSAAKNLKASTTDYTNAALIYYQQGLSDQQVEMRTNVTLKVANVTNEDAKSVSQQLTAVWNGYQVESEDAEKYIDKLAAVASRSASNLAELSTGMAKVASAANAMGVDVDQLNAQLATIISVTRQAPESVGTALKTIYARMSQIAAGEDGEISLGNYTSKMADMGVNVLNAQGELRDMGEVIEEVGSKWASYSKEQQMALAQTMAGTRQYNNMIALFDNWSKYQELTSVSKNSEGTLNKQQKIYSDSIEANLKQLRASIEGIWNNFYDPEVFNGVIKALTSISNLIGTISKGLGGMSGLMKMGGSLLVGGIAQKGAQAVQNKILASHQVKRNDIKIEQVSRNLKGMSENQNLSKEDRELIDRYQKISKLAKGGNVSTERVNALGTATENWSNARNQHQEAKEDVKKIRTEAAEKKITGSIQDIAQRYGELATAISNATKNALDAIKNAKEKISNSAGKIATGQKGKVATGHQEIDSSVRTAISELQKQKQALSTQGNTEDAAIIQDKIGELKKARENLERAINEYSSKGSAEALAIAKQGVEELQRKLQDAATTAASIGNAQQKENSTNQRRAAEAGQREQQTSMNLTAARRQVDRQFEDANTEAITSKIKAIASAASSLVAVFSALSNVVDVWKDDSLSDWDKVLATFGSVLSILPALIAAFTALKGAIGGVATVALLLVAAFAAVIIQLSNQESELEKLNKKIDKTKKAYDTFKGAVIAAKQVVTDTKNAVADYRDAEQALKHLTTGTEQWAAAMDRVNSSVTQLLRLYPTLAGYVRWDANAGRYVMDEAGLQMAQELAAQNELQAIGAMQITEGALHQYEARAANLARSKYTYATWINRKYKINDRTLPQYQDFDRFQQYLGDLQQSGNQFEQQSASLMLQFISSGLIDNRNYKSYLQAFDTDESLIDAEDMLLTMKALDHFAYRYLDQGNIFGAYQFPTKFLFWPQKKQATPDDFWRTDEEERAARHQAFLAYSRYADTYARNTNNGVAPYLSSDRQNIIDGAYGYGLLNFFDTDTNYTDKEAKEEIGDTDEEVTKWVKDYTRQLYGQGATVREENGKWVIKIGDNELDPISLGQLYTESRRQIEADAWMSNYGSRVAYLIDQVAQENAGRLGKSGSWLTVLQEGGTSDLSQMGYLDLLNFEDANISELVTSQWMTELLTILKIDPNQFEQKVAQSRDKAQKKWAELALIGNGVSDLSDVIGTAENGNGIFGYAKNNNWTYTQAEQAAKFTRQLYDEFGSQTFTRIQPWVQGLFDGDVSWLSKTGNINWGIGTIQDARAGLKQFFLENGRLDLADLVDSWEEEIISHLSNIFNKTAFNLKGYQEKYQKILGVMEKQYGDTIDAETYNSLSDAAKEYFVLMADGTYKMIGEAKTLKKILKQEAQTSLKRQIRDTKGKIDKGNQALKDFNYNEAAYDSSRFEFREVFDQEFKLSNILTDQSALPVIPFYGISNPGQFVTWYSQQPDSYESFLRALSSASNPDGISLTPNSPIIQIMDSIEQLGDDQKLEYYGKSFQEVIFRDNDTLVKALNIFKLSKEIPNPDSLISRYYSGYYGRDTQTKLMGLLSDLVSPDATKRDEASIQYSNLLAYGKNILKAEGQLKYIEQAGTMSASDLAVYRAAIAAYQDNRGTFDPTEYQVNGKFFTSAEDMFAELSAAAADARTYLTGVAQGTDQFSKKLKELMESLASTAESIGELISFLTGGDINTETFVKYGYAMATSAQQVQTIRKAASQSMVQDDNSLQESLRAAAGRRHRHNLPDHLTVKDAYRWLGGQYKIGNELYGTIEEAYTKISARKIQELTQEETTFLSQYRSEQAIENSRKASDRLYMTSLRSIVDKQQENLGLNDDEWTKIQRQLIRSTVDLSESAFFRAMNASSYTELNGVLGDTTDAFLRLIDQIKSYSETLQRLSQKLDLNATQANDWVTYFMNKINENIQPGSPKASQTGSALALERIIDANNARESMTTNWEGLTQLSNRDISYFTDISGGEGSIFSSNENIRLISTFVDDLSAITGRYVTLQGVLTKNEATGKTYMQDIIAARNRNATQQQMEALYGAMEAASWNTDARFVKFTTEAPLMFDGQRFNTMGEFAAQVRDKFAGINANIPIGVDLDDENFRQVTQDAQAYIQKLLDLGLTDEEILQLTGWKIKRAQATGYLTGAQFGTRINEAQRTNLSSIFAAASNNDITYDPTKITSATLYENGTIVFGVQLNQNDVGEVQTTLDALTAGEEEDRTIDFTPVAQTTTLTVTAGTPTTIPKAITYTDAEGHQQATLGTYQYPTSFQITASTKKGGNDKGVIGGITNTGTPGGNSGSLNNPQRKGGGGGGKKATPKPFIEKDPYHDVNNTIEELTHTLKMLQEQQEKVMGADLVSTLNQQLQIMKKQNEQYALKLKIAQKVGQEQREQLTKLLTDTQPNGYVAQVLGIDAKQFKTFKADLDKYFSGQFDFMFDEDGYIDADNLALLEKRWQEILDNIYQEKGGLNMSEANSKSLSSLTSYIKKVQEATKKLDETASLMRQVEEQIQTQAYTIISTQVQQFKLLADTLKNTSEAYKTFNKYQSTVLSGLGSDSKLSSVTEKLLNLKSALNMDQIGSYSNYIERLIEAAETIQNGGLDQFYSTISNLNGKTYSDVASLLTDLKEMNQTAMKVQTEIRDSQQAVVKDWSDEINEVTNAYSSLLEAIEAVEKQLEHERKVIELVYGEKSYGSQQKYLQQQVAATGVRIGALVAERNMLAQQIQNANSRLLDFDPASAEAASIRQSLINVEKEFLQVTSSLNDAIANGLETIQQTYTNKIEDIALILEKKLTDTLGYDWIGTEWDMLTNNPFEMFDSIDAAFAIESIKNEYESAINDMSNVKIQNELQELLDSQLSTLQQQGFVSKYNLEYAEKLLAVKKAQAELEDAEANKSTLRLRRDSQGNYTYQYVSDQDEVLKKQEELKKAQQEFYDWARDSQAEFLNNWVSEWSSSLDKIKELYSSFKNGQLDKEGFNREVASILDISGTTLEQGLNVIGNGEWGLNYAVDMDLSSLGLDSAIDRFGVIQALIGDRETSMIDMINKVREGDYESIGDLLSNQIVSPMQQALENFMDVENEDSALSEFLQIAGINLESLLAGEGSDASIYDKFDTIIENNTSALQSEIQILESIQMTMDEYLNIMKEIEPGLAHMNENIINGFSLYASLQKDNAAAYTGVAFDTGGYTGSWGSEGKLAMLHQKELILNASDTQNMLDAVKLVRDLDSLTSMEMATQMNSINSMIDIPTLTAMASALDQNVHIEANFPNVSSSSEIRAALNNLVNTASQRAMMRK